MVNDGKRRGYAFSGTIALDRLLSGIVDLPTVVTSPTGTVDGWPLEVNGFADVDAA